MVAARYVRHEPEQTLLYQILQENLETFLQATKQRGGGLPRYVRQTFRRFLGCGILQNGFVRVRCTDCGFNNLVAFSCKERSLCPSCSARRMSDIALHLVDRVFPQVPVRQWVLSLPRKLRYIFARDAKLLSAGLRIFASEVFRHIRKTSGVRPRGRALPGGVTSIQRHGGALNLNVHFHSLFLDGVYVADPRTGVLEFVALPEPREEELFIVVRRTSGRIQEMLRRKGVVLYPNAGEQEEESTGEHELFQTLQGAAVAEWAVMGDQPHPIELDGRRKGPPPPWLPKPCTATCDEFSLNAGVRIGEGNREGLENLCRYVLRPAFSQERLERLPDGRIRYSFRKPRFNGATSVTLKPLEFMACPPKLYPQGERRREKLAALVPPPRTHLVVYHGLFGPRNRLRNRVVPKADNPNSSCRTYPRRT